MRDISRAHILTIPPNISDEVPGVFDDTSLAYTLGIRTRTLWWLLQTQSKWRKKPKKGVEVSPLYKMFKIPKRSDPRKHRIIFEPREALMNIQKSMLVSLFGALHAPPHIGAYVPGRDLQFTAAQHTRQAVKISMDIKDFFPSTRRRWVKDWIRTFGYDKWVVDTLSTLLTVNVSYNGTHRSFVPQGAPTSGLVTNYVALQRLDTPIMLYLAQLEGSPVYTRYSDNMEISFSTPISREEVDKVVSDVSDLIRTSGYRVNNKKTTIQRATSPKQAMRVLGMTVNEKVNVPQHIYRALRAEVHNCTTTSITTQARGVDPQVYFQKLRGRVTYWANINPERLNPLKLKLLQAAIVQGFIVNPSEE